MMQFGLIGIGAGAAAALLFASLTSGSMLSIILFYLAPLPVMIAGLGWSHWAALVAATAGSLAIAAAFGGILFFTFLVGIGAPAWWLCYLSALGRPFPAAPGGTPEFEWYPPGRLVLWAAILGAVFALLVSLSMANFSLDADSFRSELGAAFSQLFGLTTGADGAASFPGIRNPARFIEIMVTVVPPAAAVAATVTNVVNLWLAGRVAKFSGRLIRPWPDIAALTLRSFPDAPVPNKLLQEFRALAAASASETPLTEELAADIFMGAFTDKFVLAAQRAAALLEGSLYARYYDIVYAEIAGLRVKPGRSGVSDAARAFARLCCRRAGVSPGWGRVARNGMVIEQQQILTTQNLAALWSDLPLREALGADLPGMCHRVFRRISGSLAIQPADRHAQLIQLKNAAYAWRQLLFFLSMLDPGQQCEFLDWARRHLDGPAHRVLRPLAAVLAGLEEVLAGAAPGRHVVRPFLGWVDGAHPLAL